MKTMEIPRSEQPVTSRDSNQVLSVYPFSVTTRWLKEAGGRGGVTSGSGDYSVHREIVPFVYRGLMN
jgi:hypothetical protein